MYGRFGKRFLDIAVCLPGSILLAIPVAVIAVLICLDSKGPAFFIQQRLGRNGRIFGIWKFRTMQHRIRESTEQIMPDHPEVTGLGKFLRRFKLDETPQLVNVVIGDMSIIGPRPCLPELQQKFDENGFVRLKVRPGLFGLADIEGGYYLSWPQRWVHDRHYVKNLSLWLDLKLAFMALPIILFDEDYYLKRNKKN